MRDVATSPQAVQIPPAAVPAPSYLTAEQVGELLQLSAKSIYRLAKTDPSLPMLKIGGTVRFPRERLERWLRDREQGRGRPRLAAIAQPHAAKAGDVMSSATPPVLVERLR